MESKTIQEWAEFYVRNTIYVYPNIPGISPNWDDNCSKPTGITKNINWNNVESLYCAIGKEDIRTLTIYGIESQRVKKYIVNTTLLMLGLPKDYRWILTHTGYNTLTFIFKTYNKEVKDNFLHKTFVKLQWKGYTYLPSINKNLHFYSYKIPVDSPKYVDNDKLFKCFNYWVVETARMKRCRERIKNSYKDLWNPIKQCILNIFYTLLGISFIIFISILLFKSCQRCTPTDPEQIHYDYDPSLHRKY